jgi:hypothetical protein
MELTLPTPVSHPLSQATLPCSCATYPSQKYIWKYNILAVKIAKLYIRMIHNLAKIAFSNAVSQNSFVRGIIHLMKKYAY